MKNATVSALANIGRRFIGGFGTRMFSGSNSTGLGPYSKAALERHLGSTLFQLGRRTFRGNRWMPHSGAKQRARHANWPDGSMHRPVGRMRPEIQEAYDEVCGGGPDHLAASAVQVSQDAFDNYEDVTHAASDAARAAHKGGDLVEWISSNTRKIGEVTLIVPAGKTPADFGVNAGGGGAPRDHESYIVRARSISPGGIQGTAKNYWPLVSLLNRTT